MSLTQKDKEILKQSLLAGEIFNTLYFGKPKQLNKLRRRARRQRRRVLMLERENPTPKLKKLLATAERWIRKDGWQVALNKASRMERDRNFRHGRLLRRILYRIRDEEAIKPGKMQSAKIIKKKKGVRITDAIYRRLLDEFGTADAMSVRGFILEDGTCLNLGQYDDHRIIVGAFTDSQAAEEKYGSRYGAFRALCQRFNMIRWIPEAKEAEVFVAPTRYQLATLRELAENGMLREVEVEDRGRKALLEAQDADTLVSGVEAFYA